MKTPIFSIYALFVVAIGISGCTSDPQHEFTQADSDESTATPEPSTPPERTNRIDGTVDGHSFGQIQSALLGYADNEYASGTIPALLLADYPFTCEDFSYLLDSGAVPVTDDPTRKVGVLGVGLNRFSAAVGAGIGDLEEDVYQVINHLSGDHMSFSDDELLAVSFLEFYTHDGTNISVYLPEGGTLEVEVVSLPDSVAGVFSMKVSGKGTLSGEFNVEECE